MKTDLRKSHLTDSDRAAIRASSDSSRALAARYQVSRRLVQFIRHPDKVTQNLAARDRRGGWRRYYDRETHAQRMRERRAREKAKEPPVGENEQDENLC